MIPGRVEPVTTPSVLKRFPDAVRIWADDGTLAGATCATCGTLTPAEGLVAHRSRPGGRRLLCRGCKAEQDRRRWAADPDRYREHARSRRGDLAARTPEQIAADRARRRPDGTKRCRYCGETLPLDAFGENRTKADGLEAYCRGCRAEYLRRYRAADPDRGREYDRRRRAELAARSPEQVAADRARRRPDGTKRCRDCGETLPLDAFSDDRTSADGLRASCRPCAYARKRARLERIVAVLYGPDTTAWRCYICGGEYDHVEHLIPRKRGGQDVVGNLHPACSRDNLSKHDSDPQEWLLRRIGPERTWEIVREFLPASLLVGERVNAA